MMRTASYIVGITQEESEMSDHVVQWNKELRLLLDQMQARPSADWTAERERVRVLTGLIAARQPVAAGAQG
jgi:hypothetical protein